MPTKEMLSSKSSSKSFVKLTDDLLFKDIFGRKEQRRFLEDFLESYYGLKQGSMHNKLKVITEYHYEKDNYQEKDVRSDIIIIFESMFINLEMYRVFNKEALRKSRHYVMKISTNQLNTGHKYQEIKKVTQINFIEKDKVNISEEFISQINLLDNYLEDISMDFVRLDKIPHDKYNESRFVKYMRFINANSYEERDNVAKGDEMLMELAKFIKEFCDKEGTMKTFDNAYWNRAIWKEEGKDEGIMEANIATAKKLLKLETLSNQDIANATSLTIEEVQKLQKDLKEDDIDF